MEKENFLSNKAIRVCLAHQLYITNIKIKLNFIYIVYTRFFFYRSYTSRQMCQLLEIYSGKKLLIICITKLLRSLSHDNKNYLFELQSICIGDYEISLIKFI
jgi:hypothetical protein